MPQKSMYSLTNALGQRLTIAANAPLTKWRIIIARILLVNLLQSSRSTFSWGSFLSFFAFKEGMLDTQISDLGVGQQYPPVISTHWRPSYKGSLGVEQPILRIFVSLTPLRQVFRHSTSS